MKILAAILTMLITLTSCLPDPVPDPTPGEERTLVIIWTIFNTDNVIKYNLYYSDNESMKDKVLYESCNEPVREDTAPEQHLTKFSMRCENFPDVRGVTIYLTLCAVTPSGNLESNVSRLDM